MDLGLTGKVAIVTGGTSGIGLAIARRLLTEGARVVVCGREADKLEASVEELRALGTVAGIAAHVDRPEDARRLVDEIVATFGGLDIVVSNAGTHLRGSLEEISAEAVLAHFRTKVLGPWELARAAAPHMRARGGGRTRRGRRRGAPSSSCMGRPCRPCRPSICRSPSGPTIR